MADGGGGYDPCECVFNREQAMQRLLSMISNGQSQCTDNQCVSNPGQSDGSSSMMMWMMALWLVVALVLFLMRPKSLRGGKGADLDEGDDHPRRRNHDNHPPPPEIHWSSSLYIPPDFSAACSCGLGILTPSQSLPWIGIQISSAEWDLGSRTCI